MKKTVQILALLILFLQSIVSPVIAVAETIDGDAPATKPVELTTIKSELLTKEQKPLAESSEIKADETYILQLSGQFTKEAEVEEAINLSLSNNFKVLNAGTEIVATDNTKLGQTTLNGSQLALTIAEKVTGIHDFKVTIPVQYKNNDSKLTEDTLTVGTTTHKFKVYQEAAAVKEEAGKTDPTKDVEKEIPAKQDSVKEQANKQDINELSEPDRKYKSGQEIDLNIIDKMEVTTTEAGLDTQIHFTINWSFPKELENEVEPGAYYIFKLPPELKVARDTEKQLMFDGQVIADLHIKTDGSVKVVFTDGVQGVEDVKGTFNFTTFINEKVVTKPQDITIKIPIKDGDFKIDVPIDTKNKQTIEKTGAVDKSLNPKEVTWKVIANKTQTKVTDLVITDTMPEEVTFKNVKVYTVDYDFNGKYIEGSRKEAPTGAYTVDAAGVVKFPGVTKQAYELVYTTEIKNESKLVDGGKATITNNVTATSTDGETLSTKAEVNVEYGKLLVKETTKYDQDSQTFYWKIKYNYGDKKIPAEQAFVTDTPSKNLDFLTDSLKVTKKDGTNTVLTKGVDYTLTNEVVGGLTQYKIKFTKEINEAYDIEYGTKLGKGIIVDEKGMDINNQIGTYGYTGNSVKGKFISNGLIKGVSKNVPNPNYDNQTIAWGITVNRDRNTMNNWVMTDTFPNKGLTFKPETFTMHTLNGDKQGTTLVEGQDYKLTDKGKDGFVVELIGNYAKTDQAFGIVYSTDYNKKNLSKLSSYFINEATAKWFDNDRKEYNDKSQASEKTNDQVLKNGSKSGSYNATTKEITWTVMANYNREDLVKGQIIDPITGNQQLIKESITLESFKINPDGSVQDIGEIKPVNFKVESSKELKEILTVNLPENSKGLGYRLVFKTSLKGQVILSQDKYTNYASLYDNDSLKDTLEGKVSIANGGKFVSKKGTVDNKQDSTKIAWELTANPSLSTVENYVVIDKPSYHQTIDEGTIKVTELVANEAGKLAKTTTVLAKDKDYTVELVRNDDGEQIMTIKFINKIDKAYLIEYTANLDLAKTDREVTNSVSMSGDNSQTYTEEVSEKVEVISNQSGGNAEVTRTNFYFKKVSTELGKKVPLKGIKFEVTNNKTNKVILVKETDEDGIVAVKNITTGNYTIRELATPDRYLISPELTKGKVIQVTKNNATAATAYEIENKLNSVEFTKVDDQGAKLKNVSFSLSQKDSAGNYVAVAGYEAVKTNDKGVLKVEGLLKGDYRFTENAAPSGYIKNTKAIDFTITGEETQATVLNDFVNYRGRISLKKTDGADKPLAGAVFTITNENDSSQTITVTSDQNGLVSYAKLAPGSYSIKETTPPAGYIINPNVIKFTIDAEGNTEPVTKDLGAVKNFKGSASLLKVDAVGKELAGATFKVVRKANGSEGEKVVLDNLTSQAKTGLVLAEGLDAGNYYFAETKAAPGYILNTQKYDFEIVASTEVEPTQVKAGTAVNYQGSVQFTKELVGGTQAKNKLGLKNVKFELLQKVKDQYTKIGDGLIVSPDENGLVKVSSLVPGDYKFIEKATDANFILNPTEIPFSIKAEQAGKVETQTLLTETFKNYSGSAQLQKVDETNKALAGAVFKVYHAADNKEVADVTITEEAGLVTATGLGSGDYYFKEIKAPTGFIINNNHYQFTIAAKAAAPVAAVVIEGNVINYKGKVEFTKVSDKLTKDNVAEPLSGAEFKLWEFAGDKDITEESLQTADRGTILKAITDPNKAQTTEAVSATNGKVVIDGLAPGTYVLEEVKAPTGHVKSKKLQKFTIPAEAGAEKVTLTLNNFANYLGAAQINKVNQAGEALPGATFTVFDKDDQEVKGLTMTEKDGLTTAVGLGSGQYYFKETKAPAGYIINETNYSFTIAAEADRSFEPVKVLDDKQAEIKAVNYQGTATLSKVNEAGDLLPGAEFAVYDAKTNQKAVGVTVTETTPGKFSATGLAPGTYYFQEEKAPTSYVRNLQTVSFTISDSSATGQVNMDNLKLTNYQGSARLEKGSANNLAVAGTMFKVTDGEGQTIPGQEELTVEADGYVTAKNLAPGTYHFVETKAVSGQIINITPVEFTILGEAEGRPEEVQVGKIINYQGSAKLKKVSATELPVEGTTFKVTDKEGQTVVGQEELTVAADGYVTASKLAPGTYHFVETKAVSGQIINTTPVEFVIPEEAADEPLVVTENNGEELSLTNYQGSVELVKADQDGKGLGAAEFTLYNKAGEVVLEKLVSDEDGKVKADHLAPGEYYFEETKAPSGYILNTNKVEFVIADSSENGKVEVTGLQLINYQGSVILTKEDASDEKVVLANAKFNLVSETQKVIANGLTTDQKGQIKVDKLAPGTYYFVETEAPKGYELDPTPVKVVIETSFAGQPEVVQVVKENIKTPETPTSPEKPVRPGKPGKPTGPKQPNKSKLPKTSSQTSLSLIAFGSGIVSLVVYVKRRRNAA